MEIWEKNLNFAKLFRILLGNIRKEIVWLSIYKVQKMDN